jgi:hypothetical protein
MTHPTLLMQARQGDETAIAALLNRVLAYKNITATLQLEQGCLNVHLWADPLPDPNIAITLLDRELARIRCPLITSVAVTASVTGSAMGHIQDGAQDEEQAGAIAHWHQTFIPGTHLLSSPTSHEALEAVSANQGHRSDPAPIPEQDRSSRSQNSVHNASLMHPSLLQPSRLSSEGRNAVLIGFALGVVLFMVPLFNVLFRGFLVLVHEVGHALFHWLFGRPALPTVNLLHGGGITLFFEQSAWVIGLIYLAIAAFAYLCRFYPAMLVLTGVCTAVYTVCLATPTNMMLSVLMGHGMELVAIAACLYLCVSGRLCRFGGDRSIYGMLGFFTLFCDLQFSWQLVRDENFRAWYEGGIGNVIDNDFMILATEYFAVDLSAIANAFFLGCIIAPILAFLGWRYEAWLQQGWQQLFKASWGDFQ